MSTAPTMNFPLPLAMGIPDGFPGVVYLSLNLLLALGTFASLAVFLVLAHRYFPFHKPYFSGLFVLTLCPLVCTFALALVRHGNQFDFADPSFSNVVEKLYPSSGMLLFGLLCTAAALAGYTWLYRRSQRARPA